MRVTGLVAISLLVVASGLLSAQRGAIAADAKPLKVLLVVGGCCHDYSHQKDVLKAGLEKRINVEVTIAYDPDNSTRHLNPIYESDDWAKGYDVIIHDECSADVKDMPTVKKILKPHLEGVPAVVLHCGMHCYRTPGWNKAETPTPWQELLGLQSSGHRRQAPIEVTYVDTDHAITKGLENWTTINEELYNNFAGKLLPSAHALARGKQDNNNDVVTWTNIYNDKTRIFCTTLGHNTQTVNDDRYLDLVARGLLWSCGKLKDDGSPADGYGK